MRKIALLWTICLSTLLANAQIENFDLSTYKLPDLKRHQLDFNVEYNGGNSYYEKYQRLGTDYTNKTNDFGGGFGIGYRFYRNNQTYQGNQYIGIGLNSDFSDKKDENGYVGEQFNFSDNITINSYNRFYVKDKFFLESDLLFSQYYSKRNRNDDLYNDETINKNIQLDAQLGFGYGRIEQVQDAWLATYILEELQENGKLLRVPTNEEILEFSSLISQLKNERFFDARLQKMKEIEEVDKFLQSRNLIDQADARYFTIVNDNWDHAATQIRRAGKVLSFLVIPSISSYSNFIENEHASLIHTTERKDAEYKVQFQLNFITDKPINKYWQRRFRVSLSGDYMQGLDEIMNDDLKNKTEISSPQLNSMLQYSLAYYPNSRTNLSVGADIYFKNYFGTENFNSTEYDINYLKITPSIHFNLSFYISPQLILDASYYVHYDYTESNSRYYDYVAYDDFIKINRLNQYIDIGFKYQIF